MQYDHTKGIHSIGVGINECLFWMGQIFFMAENGRVMQISYVTYNLRNGTIWCLGLEFEASLNSISIQSYSYILLMEHVNFTVL